MLDVLAHDAPAPSDGGSGGLGVGGSDARVWIVGYPARDEADALALEMVRRLLDPVRYRFEVIGSAMLTAEVVAWVDERHPALLCIGALAPGGLSQARHLCKRLRSQCPELKIVVGRWGLHDERDADRQELLAAGADHVDMTVLDTQRTLAEVGLTLARPALESPSTSASEAGAWAARTAAPTFGCALDTSPASLRS
jgi:DNA-binding NarL/FixJ family response regulator